MRLGEIGTPAVVVDREALEHNLAEMSGALPGPRLRPHVKAHKTTALARLQRGRGHAGFTCATVRECEGLAAAGLGEELLLANEVLDGRRLAALARLTAGGNRVTVAVDSEATAGAAAGAGIREVLVDVNVGLRRCGCRPEDAGALADSARRLGLDVRGVMGYEGHVVGVVSAREREEGCRSAMELLCAAAADAGGDVVSAGGTGTYAINSWANEIQAGTYVLMDTAYGSLGLPFRQAVFVAATVISRQAGYAVADCGLKSLGMDHGNPAIADTEVWFCSDEHVTFAPGADLGRRVLVEPAHLDPTLAYHERMHLVEGLLAARAAGSVEDAEVLDTWQIDLRGW